MIPETIINQYGGQRVTLQKDAFLFNEGEQALHYFQVLAGAVKMVNYSYDGQEFIQGIFGPGESFGEPPLFADFAYPSSAIATTEAMVLRLRKEEFIDLLRHHFEIHLQFSRVFSQRLRYKSMILREMSSYAPEHRILALITYFREKADQPLGQAFLMPFTRQQIADMTGLRVETVIRAVTKLKQEGKLQVIRHKIYV